MHDWIPFIAAATGATPKFSLARITEAIIIAAITAVASSYAVVWRLEERVASMQRDIQRLEASDVEQDKRIYDALRGH